VRGRVEELSAAHPIDLRPRGARAFIRCEFLTLVFYLPNRQTIQISAVNIHCAIG
jgi:hypothetical protein